MARSFLRLPAVKQRTGLSRPTIYARMAEGTFPRQVSLGGRAVGWVEDQIEEWVTQQIERGRKVRNDRHPNGRLKAGRSEQPCGES
jgi:prophage regulatory protein